MAGNQAHGRLIARERAMREHDALPRLARLVGYYTVSAYDAESCANAVTVARRFTFGGPSDVLAKALALLDEHEGEETFRLYGPDHPECPPRYRRAKPPKGAWWASSRRGAQ